MEKERATNRLSSGATAWWTAQTDSECMIAVKTGYFRAGSGHSSHRIPPRPHAGPGSTTGVHSVSSKQRVELRRIEGLMVGQLPSSEEQFYVSFKGLAPSSRAHRSILLRRLSFVLTGLPPASAGRHWMNVVRYSDTYGYEWDIPAKGAWRCRDYLIRAFNNDVAFDQLVREQIAGDLLPNARLNPVKQINESLIGPMFFQMGEKRHGDSLQFNGIHQEMLDKKIYAFSKASRE